MAKKQVKVVDAPDYRVCPVCLSGALLDMGYYLYCPTEDPHPGGVVVYNDGRVVRADRHLPTREAIA
jgi:hypothetical protein